MRPNVCLWNGNGKNKPVHWVVFILIWDWGPTYASLVTYWRIKMALLMFNVQACAVCCPLTTANSVGWTHCRVDQAWVVRCESEDQTSWNDASWPSLCLRLAMNGLFSVAVALQGPGDHWCPSVLPKLSHNPPAWELPAVPASPVAGVSLTLLENIKG